MTKILNSYGDLVDDYQTALDWAKKAPWRDIKCKNCKSTNDEKSDVIGLFVAYIGLIFITYGKIQGWFF